MPSKLQEYPTHQHVRSGCKVSWLYYAKEEDARKAAAAAKANAKILAAQGFDFGYQSPGYIDKLADDLSIKEWSEYAGMYEVCIP